MSSLETINFDVTLSGTFWEKRPAFSIWLGNQVIVQSEIPDSNQHIYSFSREVNEGQHFLQIRLENKTPYDTIVKDNEIVKDMLLNIDNISIDEIDLNNLLHSESTYILDQPQKFKGSVIKELPGCVNLGWNGAFIFKFSSPTYVWLLEKL